MGDYFVVFVSKFYNVQILDLVFSDELIDMLKLIDSCGWEITFKFVDYIGIIVFVFLVVKYERFIVENGFVVKGIIKKGSGASPFG